MKVYTRDSKGTWSEPISEDASRYYDLLPDAPNDRFRMLVGYYSILYQYYRFVARRGENEGIIVEELSEKDARSLSLAYLKGDDVFRAACGNEDGIAALIRQFPVREEGLLIMLGAGVSLRKGRNFSNDLAERIRSHRMQREMGPRIILSDSRTSVEEKDPDLRLVPAKPAFTPAQIIAGAAIVAAVLGITFYLLLGSGNDETSQKKTEDATQTAVVSQFPSLEQSKETCKCTDARPKCGPGCTCKTTKSCTCPPEASAESEQLPSPAEQESSSHE